MDFQFFAAGKHFPYMMEVAYHWADCQFSCEKSKVGCPREGECVVERIELGTASETDA
jgi:hypothetical protein